MKRTLKHNGVTLVELLIATSIAVLVVGALFSLFVIAIKEQRDGIIDRKLREHADRVQDFITNAIRNSSQDGGMNFTEFVTSDGYYRVVTFKETAEAEKVHKLQYFPSTKTLTYYPDSKTTTGGVTVGYAEDAKGLTHLDDVRFIRLLQATGNQPSSSVMLVRIEVSDHGITNKAKKNPDDRVWEKEVRVFAVGPRAEIKPEDNG